MDGGWGSVVGYYLLWGLRVEGRYKNGGRRERSNSIRQFAFTKNILQKIIMKGVYKLGTYIPRIAASCWVAPNAAVVGNVILHEHASVWFGVTIRGDNPEPIVIGPRSNVQDGAVMHADEGVPLTVGSGVTIGHQAMVRLVFT